MFKKYEFEIPPEDPGALLGTSGKVPENQITNNGWTEFKLQTPVKVVKGEKYWLTNTTFQKAYGTGTEEFHKYQLFYHERVSNTEDQPWGNYTNEPKNWEHAARTLRELPSPEQTKINCEKCNNEGWLQEEPKGFDLLNTNRGAQEEGGQTYSYASGTIEEGAGQEAPAVQTEAAAQVTKSRATVKATVNPNGEELSDCTFEYGPTASYGSTAPCSPQPAVSESPTPVAATIRELSTYTVYHYRITATNASGTSNGGDQTFRTLSAGPTVHTDSAGEIAQTHATLTATVNPNGEEVSDCTLEYGPTTGYGSSAPCTPQPGAGETTYRRQRHGVRARRQYHLPLPSHGHQQKRHRDRHRPDLQDASARAHRADRSRRGSHPDQRNAQRHREPQRRTAERLQLRIRAHHRLRVDRSVYTSAGRRRNTYRRQRDGVGARR